MPFSFSARAPAVARAAALIVVFATNTAVSDPLSPSDASLAALRGAVREAWIRHPAAEATEQALDIRLLQTPLQDSADDFEIDFQVRCIRPSA